MLKAARKNRNGHFYYNPYGSGKEKEMGKAAVTASFTCPKCHHTETMKAELLTSAQLLGFNRFVVGGPMNHRLEAVFCGSCGFVDGIYYRGRVF